MDLNKKITKVHQGYQLQRHAKSLLTIPEVKTLYKKLKKIPYKISCFIDRKTIKEVFKYDEYTYYVIDINNEVFILDY